MNFALPAAVLILALLPGIVFRQVYLSGKFPHALAGQSPIAEFAQYVVWALPLDAVAYYSVRSTIEFPPLNEFLRLLSGSFLATRGVPLEDALSSHAWWPVLLSYLSLLIASAILGAFCRRVVWASRLDVRWRFLRVKSDWYYNLHGRLAYLPRQVLPIADVLVEHEGTSRLYQGIVVEFEVDRDGDLREIILREAKRYRPVVSGETESPWKAIPGYHFVLPASRIENINLRYVSIEHPPSGRIRGWLHSFWIQDP